MTLACGCPEHFPDWDGQDIDLGGRLVHALSIPTFMHMPLAYELYVKRQQQSIEQLGLEEEWPGLVLARTGFLRGSIIRLLVNTRSPARNIHILPRPFWVRAALHRGNLSTGRKVIQRIQMELVDAGRRPKELYLSYLSCPNCNAERGGELILFLRRWEESAVLKKRLSKRGSIS